MLDLSTIVFNTTSDDDSGKISDMTISKEGIAELGSYEGCILTPYLDSVGVKTIGFGATKSDIADLDDWSWDKEITLQQAADYLVLHVRKYMYAVNTALKVDVNQHQFDALVSFVYNLGVGIVRGSLFQAVNSGASADEITDCFMKYVYAGGNELQGLVNRRRAEAALYNTGVYKSRGMVELNTTYSNHEERSTGKTINLLSYI